MLKDPTIRIEAGNANDESNAVSITDPKQVLPVVERFRDKYGNNDVKKYYSKLDVAVLARLR